MESPEFFEESSGSCTVCTVCGTCIMCGLCGPTFIAISGAVGIDALLALIDLVVE